MGECSIAINRKYISNPVYKKLRIPDEGVNQGKRWSHWSAQPQGAADSLNVSNLGKFGVNGFLFGSRFT
jgi:hypothetical protein